MEEHAQTVLSFHFRLPSESPLKLAVDFSRNFSLVIVPVKPGKFVIFLEKREAKTLGQFYPVIRRICQDSLPMCMKRKDGR